MTAPPTADSTSWTAAARAGGAEDPRLLARLAQRQRALSQVAGILGQLQATSTAEQRASTEAQKEAEDATRREVAGRAEGTSPVGGLETGGEALMQPQRPVPLVGKGRGVMLVLVQRFVSGQRQTAGGFMFQEIHFGGDQLRASLGRVVAGAVGLLQT